MYPSSTSSSSQGSMGTNNGGRGGGSGDLIRYGSAPGSLLATTVDSLAADATLEFSGLGPHVPARFFHSEVSESAAAAMAATQNGSLSRRRGDPNREEHSVTNTTIGLQPSYGYGGGGGSSSELLRQSSSPAGFLNQVAAAAGDRNAGFSVTRGVGIYNPKGTAEGVGGGGVSRLNSQLSFNGKEEQVMDNHQKKSYAATSGGAFGMWEPSSNPMFSVVQPNRGKNVAAGLDAIESQFQFSISQTSQDMTSMEKMLNIPQDSVTCKIRAKRGFATHPRSIAERERRTRISGKLRKLQDLVPNMDKQTSYADMLDLAVQHIKTLQNEVEKLNHDLDGCSCGCKKTRDS